MPPAPPPASWASRRRGRRGDLARRDGAGCHHRRCRPPPATTRCGCSTCSRVRCTSTARFAGEGHRRRGRGHLGRAARGRARGRGDPRAPGPPHRRARGAVRPVRDEHPARRSSRRSATTAPPASAAGRGIATDPVHGGDAARFARHAERPRGTARLDAGSGRRGGGSEVVVGVQRTRPVHRGRAAVHQDHHADHLGHLVAGGALGAPRRGRARRCSRRTSG